MSLQHYAHDTYSQSGEDGILEEVLTRIARERPLTQWCAEVGAWDGQYLSNTAALIRHRGFRAVLIEGDPERAAQITSSHPGVEVVVVQRYIGLEDADGLDAVLTGTGIPVEFDVLSVDVDGCDYWLLDRMVVHRPSVIVVEYNPTIPNEVAFVQARDASVCHGSSARALVNLARRLGYGLVAVTALNLILVTNELLPAVIGSHEGHRLEDLRDDGATRTFVFSGYDGTVMLSAPLRLPWHGVTVEPTALQPLPATFRRYPGDFTPEQQQAFADYKDRTAGTATASA